MYKKIAISLMLVIILIAISTYAFAGMEDQYPPDGGAFCLDENGRFHLNTDGTYDELNSDTGDYPATTRTKITGTKESSNKYTAVGGGSSNFIYDYIVAQNVCNRVKQVAIWGGNAPSNIGTLWPGVGSGEISQGASLYQEAQAAQQFVNDGFTVTDKTDYDNLKVIKSGDKSFKIGPYTIEFNDASYGSKKFYTIANPYLINSNGDKIKDVDVCEGTISSGQEFWIEYTVDGKYDPYVKLKIDFTYLSDVKNLEFTKYDGKYLKVWYTESGPYYTYSGHCHDDDCKRYHYGYNGSKYHDQSSYYIYTKHKQECTGQPLAVIRAEEVWTPTDVILSPAQYESQFDLSLKKFISKVGDKNIDLARVTVLDTGKLYSKASDNAEYSKIDTPYKIGKIDNFEYTIRIYNEGDIPGKATKIQDELPEGVEYVGVEESAGYDITEENGIITFTNKGGVADIPAFAGGELPHTDIKIKCSLNDSVYNDVTEEQKVYDLSMNQYIDSDGNKTKELKTGEEVTYSLKVKNNGEEDVYVKEIKQTLPKGIEFSPVTGDNDENGNWSILTNSDGTTECSRMVCENITGGEEKIYNIRCTVKATEGILRTISEIVSTAETDTDESDWKDYAKVVVKNDAKDYSDLKLEQTVEKVNTGLPASNGKVEKGDVVKYKITVINEGKKIAKNIKIADYIPDGMKFIPPITDSEYEELKKIADSSFNSANNTAWVKNENKNAVENKESITVEKNEKSNPIYLYCVVTEEEIDLKNIAEIVSFEDGENNIDIDSTSDNVKLSEYLYEQQEDDDAYTMLTTKNVNNISDLKISTKLITTINTNIKKGDSVKYEIKVENIGVNNAKVTIKDILNGLNYTGSAGIYDKANKRIKFEDETINAGAAKTFEIDCEITEENSAIQLLDGENVSDEEKSQYDKKVSHTAYIEKTDVYDKTKNDWKASQEICTLNAQIEAFAIKEDNNIEGYTKYLSNTAMILETSESDRDKGDWKDSDTIVIEENKSDIIIVKKEWKDSNNAYKVRPTSVTVKLYEDGSEYGEVILSESNNWKYTFKQLNPNKTYTIKEEDVDKYDTEITKNKNVYTITNYYDETKDITVNKVWKDNNNEYGLRPSSITVKLLDKNGNICRTTELDESNNWKHTFKGLNESEDYTVDEEYVEYYTKSISGYTITNSYSIPPTTNPSTTNSPTPPPTPTPLIPPTPPPTPTPLIPPTPPTPLVPITMKIAGNVFEDLPSTKGGTTDNLKGIEDKDLGGIEVALYEEGGTTLATLYQQYEENPNISQENAEIRTNPTITDEYGNYSFKGVDTLKKYTIKFKYNGVVYEPIKCNSDIAIYNTTEWEKTSKAVDDSDERSKLNTKFSEISSYPDNYGSEKRVYLQTDLENDKIYDGQNIYELIANKIRSFINTEKAYPNVASIYDMIKGYEAIDSELANKFQFIEDCKIEAVSDRSYPVYDTFVVDYNTKGDTDNYIYPGQLHINIGLVKREEFDLTIAKDVYKVELKVNDNTMTYNYNDVDIDTYTGNWVAEARVSDTFYERSIYASDYKYYKILDEEERPDKQLEVYVTYRIALRNQTSQIIGGVTEIVDYYDSEYSYVSGSTFLGNGKGDRVSDLACSTDSKYANKYYADLNICYITKTDGSDITVEAGKDQFIYIKLEVNDPDGIVSDGKINPNGIKELEKSKQNIVEINGYKTYYASNSTTVAGVLDRDSIPGNYVPSDHYDDNNKKYIADEDDVGIANGLYILIDYYSQRTITGTVWEDSPDKTLLANKIRQGDGSYVEGEKLIQNVKTSLINGDRVANYYDIEYNEWLPAEIYTDENGKYSIKGFVPGEYEVQFTYDNNSIEAKVGESSSYLETRYNGQDFKSTIYDSNLHADNYWYSRTDNSKSDAIDIWGNINEQGTREYVNNYSKTLTNNIAEKLIPSDLTNYSISETTMYARTNKMKIDMEYMKNTSQSLSKVQKSTTDNSNQLVPKDDTSKYVIANVDFGLVERPRAQLSIQKNVANVKVLLADGTVLFDATPAADESGHFTYTNLGSIARKLATAYVETEPASGADTITKLRNSTHVSTEQGRITMNMDEELMQGANLQVTYEISVENIGEKDYNTQEFYYYGQEGGEIVTTKVYQIIDYVENNMQFSNKLGEKDINDGWTVKKQDEIDTSDATKVILKEEVIKALFNGNTEVTDDAYNTIAVLTGEADKKDGSTQSISEPLKPEDIGKSDFILTQLISPENENDDLTYKNILEIVTTTNTVGRRMYFSIAGNHVPVKRDNDGKVIETAVRPEGAEIDTDDGELITIIPPFGANEERPTQIAILAIGLIAFLGAGIYLIKKKVLK